MSSAILCRSAKQNPHRLLACTPCKSSTTETRKKHTRKERPIESIRFGYYWMTVRQHNLIDSNDLSPDTTHHISDRCVALLPSMTQMMISLLFQVVRKFQVDNREVELFDAHVKCQDIDNSGRLVSNSTYTSTPRFSNILLRTALEVV